MAAAGAVDRPGRAGALRARMAGRADGSTVPAAPSLERLQAVLITLASVLLPLGLVAIVLGWYGAAHSPYGYQQLPYLISGGLLGLGLVVAGGFLYFGAWMVRGANLARRDAERTLELLERIASLLPAAGGAPDPSPEPATARSAGGARRAGGERFYATPTGSMMHRLDCPVVAGRADRRAVSAADGLRPCQICQPLS